MEAIINKLPEDINYMFYIKPKGAKRFSTYNPCKGTTGTARVFTELYRKPNLLAVCKWIAEDNSGEWVYQLRSGDGKKVYWEHNPITATPTETPRIVRIEIVRDFDRVYYANLYDKSGSSHNLSREYTDFRTLKKLCRVEYGVTVPNLSELTFEEHGRKSYAYISTQTPLQSPENVQAAECTAEGEKTQETANMAVEAAERIADVQRQLADFKEQHPQAIGAWSKETQAECIDIILQDPIFDDTTPSDDTNAPQAVNVSPEQGNAVREAENGPKRLSNGAWDIPTVDISLYRDYKAGILTLRQCAEEFHKCGWTNFIDEDYTRREFAQIEKRELAAAI